MKKLYTQALLLVSVLLLLCGASSAAEVEWWAEEAVDFAIEAGLMDGDDLCPTENATRAELAAMLVRLTGQEAQADISQYGDVSPEDWYYTEMAKALAMGVVTGTDGGLAPLDELTREEAMVMVARGFGIYGTDADTLDSFTDGDAVSTWAQTTLSAMVDMGVISGFNGLLTPQESMTRQELACLIYDCAQAYTILRGDDQAPQGTFEGNLLIGGDWNSDSLTRSKIQGDLVLHGEIDFTIAGYTTVETIVTVGQNVQLTTRGTEDLMVLNGNTTLSGGLYNLYATGDVTLLDGKINNATINSKTLEVGQDAWVKSVVLSGKGSVVTGEGTVDEALILKPDCQVLTADTVITEDIEYGISDVVMTATTPVNDLNPDNTLVSTTITFTNVPVAKKVTFRWYLGEELMETAYGQTISEGSTASYSVDIPYTEDMDESKTITLYVQYEDEVIGLPQTLDTHLELSPYNLTTVETLEVLVTATYTAPMYSGMYLTGTQVGTFYAGEVGVYDDYSSTTGRITLADGTTGWVSRSAFVIPTTDFVQYTDYTERDKLNFINQNGYTSTTDYLVWISLKTQKVNVFVGSPGEWTLEKCFMTATGKNTTPTEAGVFTYLYYAGTWNYGSFYVKNAMVFNGGHAFHSLPISIYGGLYDPTIGSPASAGCIRMNEDESLWLYQHLPLGSTVVVF